LPFPERLQKVQANSAATERAVSEHRLLILSRMLLPALSRSTEKAAELEARLRCAETALAVERNRAHNQGALPSELNKLDVPAGADVDPITGQLLHYKLLQPGYMIYSVGPDGRDDGGAERPRGRSNARRFPLRSNPEGSGSPGSVAGAAGAGSSTYDVPFIVPR
jgi:hypothetical protein